MTTHCGLWLNRRRLIAVVVDQDGRASPALCAAADTDESKWNLLLHIDQIHGLDYHLIASEELVRSDPIICQLALIRGVGLWVAPRRLIHAVRAAAGFHSGPQARVAAMIARLPLVPGFRGHLRLLYPPPPD